MKRSTLTNIVILFTFIMSLVGLFLGVTSYMAGEYRTTKYLLIGSMIYAIISIITYACDTKRN